ncbi:MAG: glycogen-binding domain-containing protein [Candidatus Cloacimonetes bacterium]|nr:glycogen-binding domain-containing protein [Candidatus Cloacimonadota bacterium]
MKRLLLILSILFLFFAQLLFAGLKETKNGIEFSYDAPNASEIFVAGSFNDWNSSKSPLIKEDDGIWRTVIDLSSGKYQYKFVVDGDWNFDQENPMTEDDGYGGANSVVKIDQNGKLDTSKKAISKEGIKSVFNPKIYFTGRYYNRNLFKKNKNSRYMLDKPRHYLQLGIKLKLADRFESFALLNLNNETELADGWKAEFNYTKAYFKIKTKLLDFNAFDDYGIITSDDPLHILGDIGKNHYKFGFDNRGIIVETHNLIEQLISDTPFSFDFIGIIADNIQNDSETNAGRAKFQYFLNDDENDKFHISLASSFFLSFLKTNTYYDHKYNNYAFDLNIFKEVFQTGWISPMKFSFFSEYYYFENILDYKLTNDYPYMIQDELVWMNGEKWYIGSKVSFPLSLDLYANYQHHNVDFFFEEEQSDIIYIPSPILNKESLDRNIFSLGANFEKSNFKSSLSLEYITTDFPDSLVNWTDYYIYMEKTNATGRWFQEHTHVPFEKYSIIGYESGLITNIALSYHTDILKYKIDFGWEGTFAQYSLFYAPKYFENIFTTTLNLNKHWNINTNTRIPIYNDEVLGIKTDFADDKDFFLSNYSEICYKLRKNVKLSLGWGVNPTVLNSVTDDFYAGGREEFLESSDNFTEYIEATYKGIGQKIRNAERALETEQRITLEAVITF